MAVLRQSGQIIPQIHYVTRHIRRMMPLLSHAMKPRARADLNAMMRWAGGPVVKSPSAPLNIVMRAASKNMHSNGYHHPWHTMTVMMMAGILGNLAGLREGDRANLICFALIHDLDHRGRFMAHATFAEEMRSATIASRRLYGRQSAAGSAIRQLKAAIMATSFAADTMGEGDAVTALLKDADILGSILFPKKDVLSLTKGLKRELGARKSSKDMLAEFQATADKRGFAHPLTEFVAAVVRGHADLIVPYSAYSRDLTGVDHDDGDDSHGAVS